MPESDARSGVPNYTGRLSVDSLHFLCPARRVGAILGMVSRRVFATTTVSQSQFLVTAAHFRRSDCSRRQRGVAPPVGTLATDATDIRDGLARRRDRSGRSARRNDDPFPSSVSEIFPACAAGASKNLRRGVS